MSKNHYKKTSTIYFNFASEPLSWWWKLRRERTNVSCFFSFVIVIFGLWPRKRRVCLKSNWLLFYVKAQLVLPWKQLDFILRLRDAAVFNGRAKVSERWRRGVRDRQIIWGFQLLYLQALITKQIPGEKEAFTVSPSASSVGNTRSKELTYNSSLLFRLLKIIKWCLSVLNYQQCL